MNDHLENRLRDALDAAAGTVPEHATGAGLATSAHGRPHRVRRIAVAACSAAAVVAAIATPLTIVHNRPDAELPVLAGGCPRPTAPAPSVPNRPAPSDNGKEFAWSGTLPAGAVPKVPFTVTTQRGNGYLQDGATRVPLPTGMMVTVLGRLDCGWVVYRTEAEPEECSGRPKDKVGEIGLLTPDGRFTKYGRTGPAASGSCGQWANSAGATAVKPRAALSPDRTKVAFVTTSRVPLVGKSTLKVVDVATGKETDRITVAEHFSVFGWNEHGIWYRSGDQANRWQPGSKPRPVTDTRGGLRAFRGTDRMVRADLNSRPNQTCDQVVEPDGDGLRQLTERCDVGIGGSSVSPDGKLMLTWTTTVRLPTGGATAYRMNAHGLWLSAGIWEDDTHVLVEHLALGSKGQPDRQVLLRCNAVSGSCERVYDALGPTRLKLGQP